ncbi:MAG: T9SS type A sorting domain-containing protein [candidate division WOR-3 bacterium]
MPKKIMILVFVIGIIAYVYAESKEAINLSIAPTRIVSEPTLSIIEPSDLLQNEDTIKYDGPTYTGIGLQNGGTFYGAVRFTPTNACTLKAGVFYQYQAVSTSGWVYIHEAGSATAPGAKIDSASYTSMPSSWVRVNFTTPRLMPAGVDFWLTVKVTHAAGTYPLGADAGPSVTPYRSFVSMDMTTWYSLVSVGLNYNWNIRALVKYPTIANDVGVDVIHLPGASHTVNTPITPIARIKNYGSVTQTNFPAVCSIIGPGGQMTTSTVSIPSLAAQETTRVSFTPMTPTTTGVCTVVVRTNLTGDQNPGNDRKVKVVQIHQFALLEGFNDVTFPPSGWQAIPVMGSYNWERKTSNTNPTCSPYEGAAMASYPAYSAIAGNMARLISPPIYCGATPVPCTLKFAMYHDSAYAGPTYGPDSVKIEYSTNGTTFTRVAAFRRWEPGVPYWGEHTVYLGAFSGTIYIGILGFSDYGNNINIDYIRLIRPTGIIEDISNEFTNVTSLNTPNPSRRDVRISFNLSQPSKINLRIYDAAGRLVKTLIDSHLSEGTYNFIWNRTDENNREVAEGIYFYTIETESSRLTKKLIITK